MRRGVWVRVSVAVFAVLAALPALTSGADAALWVPPSRGARIAIVIDDVVDGPRLGSFLTIPAPLTFAVMPFTATSAAASHRIAARGDQVIAHLPITLRRVGASGWALGRGASAEQVDAWVGRALATLPDAVGANNHKGSTTDVPTMKALMAALVPRRLFFLDSVTVGNSVGYAAAVQAGMPPRVNNLFLDASSVAVSRGRLVTLARMASRQGSAIGIGHLSSASTRQALAEMLPLLGALGYQILPLSAVTDQPSPGSRLPRTIP